MRAAALAFLSLIEEPTPRMIEAARMKVAAHEGCVGPSDCAPCFSQHRFSCAADAREALVAGVAELRRELTDTKGDAG